MKFLWLLSTVGLLLTGCAVFPPSAGNFTVNPMFGDNMVLQRDLAAPVWGTAERGRTVTVEIAGRKYDAEADQTGKWQVKLDPMPAGGPYTMTVSGRYRSVEFKNILFGDVWLCTGQSNMEWPLKQARNAAQEIAAARYPQLRLFCVTKKVAWKPVGEVDGVWMPCTPETVPNFSAVGYFFGRDLQRELNVPIGLINCNWGGTPAEAWTALGKLQASPELKPLADKALDAQRNEPRQQQAFQAKLNAYKRTVDGYFQKYAAASTAVNWTSPAFSDHAWPVMAQPGPWERFMEIDGVVQFRKTVAIPAAWAGHDLTLSLGKVDDFDQTYFNGVKVGGISGDNLSAWITPRQYTVPGKLVKPGKAVIAVAVYDHFSTGGFTGTAADMKLTAAHEDLSLAGDWRYRVAWKTQLTKPTWPEPPMRRQNLAGSLYNGMLRPIVPYGIKGAIWYQGESNAGRAYQYRTLLPAMIACWREQWGQGNFPFLIVQLANFEAPNAQPVESDWAELREAQQLTAAHEESCNIICAIDIGMKKRFIR